VVSQSWLVSGWGLSISCRLDYCNSLLYGINDGLLRRLQSVQNAAARLVTGASRRDHITPVLRRLHWLPVRQRVVFKVAGLVYQSLDGVVPVYLIDDCRPLSDAGRRPLRSSSSDIRTLVVPRTHNRFGDKFFSCRSTSLEWPSTWSTTAWTVICDFQTTTEDLSVQRPQCIETLTVG